MVSKMPYIIILCELTRTVTVSPDINRERAFYSRSGQVRLIYAAVALVTVRPLSWQIRIFSGGQARSVDGGGHYQTR